MSPTRANSRELCRSNTLETRLCVIESRTCTCLEAGGPQFKSGRPDLVITTTTNVAFQQVCPGGVVDHIGVGIYDNTAYPRTPAEPPLARYVTASCKARANLARRYTGTIAATRRRLELLWSRAPVAQMDRATAF
jgi:hypothetical protein